MLFNRNMKARLLIIFGPTLVIPDSFHSLFLREEREESTRRGQGRYLNYIFHELTPKGTYFLFLKTY